MGLTQCAVDGAWASGFGKENFCGSRSRGFRVTRKHKAKRGKMTKIVAKISAQLKIHQLKFYKKPSNFSR